MAAVIILLSYLLGGVSLLGYGAFLALGSFELVPLGLGAGASLGFDAALCFLFFLQHSGMIRQRFRRRLERVVPSVYHAAIYSAASGVVLLVLLVFWQQSDVVVWSVGGGWRWVVRGLFLAGGLVFYWAAAALGSFDFFGSKAIRHRERAVDPATPTLQIRGPYRLVRHPIYTATLILLWACPTLTLDRLLFSTLTSAWLVLGAVLEERDLVAVFGERYREYQRAVPMLVPWPLRRRNPA